MTTNFRLFYQILLMIAIGIFLFGCSKLHTSTEPTLTPNQTDKSPFSGIPCRAPCWHGLEIGKSSESDVVSILTTLTFVDQNTIYFYRKSLPNLNLNGFAPGVEIIADCAYPETPCLKMKVVDDILTEITLLLNYDIRVDEAINYLGDPDYIGYQNLGAERVICEIYLVWRDKQLILSTTFEGSKDVENNCYIVRDSAKLPSGLLISETRYMSFASIENLLSTGTGEFFEFSGTLPDR